MIIIDSRENFIRINELQKNRDTVDLTILPFDSDCKTLKDIECDESGKGDFVCESRNLREEANEWIKCLEKDRKRLFCLRSINNLKEQDAKIDWIKQFFNL